MRKFTFLIALLAVCVSAWATNTTIEWTESDLATVSVEMGYNSTGESQTIKGITVTNNAVYTAGEYCHFNTANGKLNDADWPDFSMSNGGSLTFAPESGTLTSIVIHCDMYPDDMTPLATGWEWDGENMQLKWTGNAASVTLHGDNSSTSFTSGPITLIEFTVSGFIPTTDVTWEISDLATINVGKVNGEAVQDVNLYQTVKDITVTAEAPAPVGEAYNSSFMSGDVEYGGSINVGSAGSLIFSAPEGYNLRRIVITGSGCNSGYVMSGSEYLSEEWSWSESNCKLTWSGEAASSVEMACTNLEYGNISFPLIESIVFTIAEAAPAPDTRKVPDLRFNWNYITEATIVKDSYGWIFEPGTTYNPQTNYAVYIYDDFDGNGYYYVKQPSELSLPMTFSIPNNDVIELTENEGNFFEFNVVDYGDVVVTASTTGNEEYQPASATFTIHVINGKAPTKECVLAFTSGPNAGQLVPEDYEFELQTGDEVPWMELREKAYPESVYAPSHSIWGSRNYYVASLDGEKKLRALTAGDDIFTVQYARYSDGDADGNFRLIEIPVHITPSKPALTSALDLGTDPASNPNVVLTADYDGSDHQVKVKGTLTNAQVRAAMNLWAYGTPGWAEALPNSMSFELPAGKGSFELTCKVESGYEVRVLTFGAASATCFDNASPETHTINYNLTSQKAVVIYVAEKSSPNNGPKRAPAAKNDDPLASFSALSVAPTYEITAKQDPDNTGVYYSTHFNSTQKYRLPVGTDAYVATISGEDMNLTKVVDGGDVIPANTALILRSNAASVVLTPTDEDAVTISATNILHGTDSEMPAPANCYVLSGHSTDNSVTGVGFYQFSGTLAAYKAYATISGGAAYAPKRLRFVFNIATDIDNTDAAIKSIKRIENGQLIIIRNGVKYNAAGQVVK